MIPEAAVEAAWEQARADSDGYPYPEREEIRRIIEAAAPHMTSERKDGMTMNENDALMVTIPRKQLEGWPNTTPLTGTDWRNFADSLPASEFASTLLLVADGIDRADGTGWYARGGTK